MINELRQIFIFAKTVDHGSFRAAAHALRLSPSVVSHHVGQLEQHLGTALLYRSTRKLSLTPDGKRLLAAAHKMIAAAEAGVQDVASQTEHVSGVLRLTVPALFARSDLTSQFAKFAVDYPQVRLELDYSDARRDLIADGYDVAIRAGVMKDSSLKAKKLLEMPRRLVAAPVYIKSRPKPVTPKDLKEWDWLELAPVWNTKRVFRKAGKSSVLTNLPSRISVNSAYALSHLTSAGAGLAIIPEFIAEPYVRSGDLKYILSDWAVDPIKIYAVWPPNAPRGGLIKHFVNFLSEAK